MCLLWFCFLIGQKKFAKLSQPHQTDTNQNQSWLARARFPALCTKYFYLFRFMIGLFCVPLLEHVCSCCLQKAERAGEAQFRRNMAVEKERIRKTSKHWAVFLQWQTGETLWAVRYPRKKGGVERVNVMENGKFLPPIHDNEAVSRLSRFEKEDIRAFWFQKCPAIAKRRLNFLVK